MRWMGGGCVYVRIERPTEKLMHGLFCLKIYMCVLRENQCGVGEWTASWGRIRRNEAYQNESKEAPGNKEQRKLVSTDPEDIPCLASWLCATRFFVLLALPVSSPRSWPLVLCSQPTTLHSTHTPLPAFLLPISKPPQSPSLTRLPRLQSLSSPSAANAFPGRFAPEEEDEEEAPRLRPPPPPTDALFVFVDVRMGLV